jgi:biotin operon repressor
MDQIKEAFSKVKEDIDSIHQELFNLREGFNEIRSQILLLNNTLFSLTKELSLKKEVSPSDRQTNQQTDKTILPYTGSTGNDGVPTHKSVIKPLNDQIYNSSTGNDEVPTNQQTNRQTNQQTDKSSYNLTNSLSIEEKDTKSIPSKNNQDSIENALNLLNSLDNIKKEIRLKFKKLTDQEVLVFSTLYQFDEEKGFSSYKALSEKLNLSESSIRDYIGKLIQKGIPIEKIKVNNKNIQLRISPNLKKIASLPTILQLRDL